MEFLEKRDKEIHEVLKSLEDINGIFRDVAALVSNQVGLTLNVELVRSSSPPSDSVKGTVLDQIEYNIENTAVQVEQGNKHLAKAVAHKQRGLKFKLILISVCLSVLLFIIFVAILSR